MITQQQKYRNWALVNLACFLGILFLVQSAKIQPFDHFFQQLILPFRNPIATAIIRQLTKLASPLAVGLWVILSAFFLGGHHQKQRGLATVVLFSSGGIVMAIIKRLVARPRPAGRLVGETTWSFPSGHSFGIMLLALLLYFWIRPFGARHGAWFLVGLVFMVGFIGFSRLYLMVHYPSDVLAGFLLAISWWSFFNLMWPQNKKEQ